LDASLASCLAIGGSSTPDLPYLIEGGSLRFILMRGLDKSTCGAPVSALSAAEERAPVIPTLAAGLGFKPSLMTFSRISAVFSKRLILMFSL